MPWLKSSVCFHYYWKHFEELCFPVGLLTAQLAGTLTSHGCKYTPWQVHEPLPQTCLTRQTSELMMVRRKNRRQNAAGGDFNLMSKTSCCVWSTVGTLVLGLHEQSTWQFLKTFCMFEEPWRMNAWRTFECLKNLSAQASFCFFCARPPFFVVAARLHFNRLPSFLRISRLARCQAMAGRGLVLVLASDFDGCQCEAALGF